MRLDYCTKFQFERHFKRILGFCIKAYSLHWPDDWPKILKRLNGSDHLVFDKIIKNKIVPHVKSNLQIQVI